MSAESELELEPEVSSISSNLYNERNLRKFLRGVFMKSNSALPMLSCFSIFTPMRYRLLMFSTLIAMSGELDL